MPSFDRLTQPTGRVGTTRSTLKNGLFIDGMENVPIKKSILPRKKIASSHKSVKGELGSFPWYSGSDRQSFFPSF
jgi:hypothetical protein